MKLIFRTTIFDATSHGDDEWFFYGEDLARWLAERHSGWDTDVQEADWGWGIYATRGRHHYVFGVYYQDVADASGHGPEWCVRLFNDSWAAWWRGWFRNVPPAAHAEVVDDVTRVLRADERIDDLRVEPLD